MTAAANSNCWSRPLLWYCINMTMGYTTTTQTISFCPSEDLYQNRSLYLIDFLWPHNSRELINVLCFVEYDHLLITLIWYWWLMGRVEIWCLYWYHWYDDNANNDDNPCLLIQVTPMQIMFIAVSGNNNNVHCQHQSHSQ